MEFQKPLAIAAMNWPTSMQFIGLIREFRAIFSLTPLDTFLSRHEKLFGIVWTSPGLRYHDGGRVLKTSLGKWIRVSNDDGDANVNGKKVKGLDWPNNNSARAARYFVHFFVVTGLHDNDVKMPNV